MSTPDHTGRTVLLNSAPLEVVKDWAERSVHPVASSTHTWDLPLEETIDLFQGLPRDMRLSWLEGLHSRPDVCSTLVTRDLVTPGELHDLLNSWPLTLEAYDYLLQQEWSSHLREQILDSLKYAHGLYGFNMLSISPDEIPGEHGTHEAVWFSVCRFGPKEALCEVLGHVGNDIGSAIATLFIARDRTAHSLSSEMHLTDVWRAAIELGVEKKAGGENEQLARLNLGPHNSFRHRELSSRDWDNYHKVLMEVSNLPGEFSYFNSNGFQAGNTLLIPPIVEDKLMARLVDDLGSPPRWVVELAFTGNTDDESTTAAREFLSSWSRLKPHTREVFDRWRESNTPSRTSPEAVLTFDTACLIDFVQDVDAQQLGRTLYALAARNRFRVDDLSAWFGFTVDRVLAPGNLQPSDVEKLVGKLFYQEDVRQLVNDEAGVSSVMTSLARLFRKAQRDTGSWNHLDATLSAMHNHRWFAEGGHRLTDHAAEQMVDLFLSDPCDEDMFLMNFDLFSRSPELGRQTLKHCRNRIHVGLPPIQLLALKNLMYHLESFGEDLKEFDTEPWYQAMMHGMAPGHADLLVLSCPRLLAEKYEQDPCLVDVVLENITDPAATGCLPDVMKGDLRVLDSGNLPLADFLESDHARKTIAESVRDCFGDQRHSWEVAAELLPSWEGTLSEFLDTVESSTS